MTSSSLPFASIKNDFLRLDYLTNIGPRIVGLHVNGVEYNLLAETPDVHWLTPHGEFYLIGGHRLWVAPEDPFYTCPDGDIHVKETDGSVSLQADVDESGMEKQITIRLDENRVHLSHRLIWHGENPIPFAPWGITQLRLGGMAILPLSNIDGLQPNRNLVLWPYTKLQDKRLELHDDLILLHGSVSEVACKVGNLNTHGWVACAMGDVLFVKRFQADSGLYPDLNCNVEAYVKDVCIELETLGTLKTLRKGDSLTHDETWEVTKGNFLPTLETARKVIRDYGR
jgi:hypothetical protein